MVFLFLNDQPYFTFVCVSLVTVVAFEFVSPSRGDEGCGCHKREIAGKGIGNDFELINTKDENEFTSIVKEEGRPRLQSSSTNIYISRVRPGGF